MLENFLFVLSIVLGVPVMGLAAWTAWRLIGGGILVHPGRIVAYHVISLVIISYWITLYIS